MKNPLRYRIIDAGAALFGLLRWQAEPFYYTTRGWFHSLCLLSAMRRRDPPARPGVFTATTGDLDAYAFAAGAGRIPGESDSDLRERIIKISGPMRS